VCDKAKQYRGIPQISEGSITLNNSPGNTKRKNKKYKEKGKKYLSN